MNRLAPSVGDGDSETISIMPPLMGSIMGAQSVSQISNINVALPSNGGPNGQYQRYHSPVSVVSKCSNPSIPNISNINFSRQSSVQTVVSAQSGTYLLWT